MKVKLDLFFNYVHLPAEKPDDISDEDWNVIQPDFQETYGLYINEPHLMEEKVKSNDAEENFETLFIDLDDEVVRAEWVNGEFAVELKVKTKRTVEDLKERLLTLPLEDYLWHKTEDAWNIWTLHEKYPFAFTDYRRPENITVTQVYPGGARRKRHTVRRRARK